jgi:Undecaprenyl-phosphate glucose phosphotransferase
MNTIDLSVGNVTLPITPPHRSRLPKRDFASLASDLLPPCDFVCFLLAGYISTLVYSLLFPPAPLDSAIAIGRGNVALIGAVLAPFILYDRHFAAAVARRETFALACSYALRFVLISAVALAIGVTSRLFDNLPPSWVALWLVASLVLTALMRSVVATNVLSLRKKGAFTQSVAIFGAGPLADRLNRHLRETKADGVQLLGVFDDRPAGVTGSSTWPAGSFDALVELSRRRTIDWILIALPADEEVRVQAIVARLEGLSSAIALCPQNVGFKLPGKRVDYTRNGMPVMLLADRPMQRWDAVVKAAEDAILGRILIVLLLPVFALIALAIKLDGPGPIVFKQRRHAFNNAEFDIYKFRTMRVSADAAGGPLQQTLRFDQRVTTVGRFLRATSLDELPQLFNVLKGEMSLVGPRPHAVNMRTEDLLGSEITDKYPHRHRVKPGMTGWSQVNGARGATTTTAQLRRRVGLDLMYIDNWSLWLDLKILVLTCREVLKRTNAY